MKEKWALFYEKHVGEKERLVLKRIEAVYRGPDAVFVGDEFDGVIPLYHYKVVAVLSEETSHFLTVLDDLMGDNTINLSVLEEIVDKTVEVTERKSPQSPS